ncbi:MAG: FAD-binding oxidoreductase, partial [Acidobacteria bacterium]|nr:FAD-binding oxidoreductase [Acidobacteriota bacterium]
AGHRQWLPLDAPEGATIGGVIATNDSGPLRHRYGTPRDLLIGVQLATTDGRLIKAGGNVVKNVAGYDLGKLVSGSFGSLAAIVSATFKLLPAPAASRTLVAGFRDPQAAAGAAAAIGNSQLEPMALEVHASAGPPCACQLLVRFATSPAATLAQIAAAREMVASNDIAVAAGPDETTLWRDHAARVWAAPGAVVKLTWLPAALAQVLTAIADLPSAAGVGVQLAGRAGVGSGLLRIEGDPAAQAAAVGRLRARPDLVRHVTVLRASPALKQNVDVWGPSGVAGALAGSIKRALDPAGILNAGRGPV